MTDAHSYSIGEAARRTGLSVHTLRYYEQAGVLVEAPYRTGTGRRQYSDNDIEWLTVCAKLRETGMSIEDLSHYAALLRDGAETEAQRLTLLTDHRAKVLAEIEKLNQNLELINLKITAYTNNLRTQERQLPPTTQARTELQPR